MTFRQLVHSMMFLTNHLRYASFAWCVLEKFDICNVKREVPGTMSRQLFLIVVATKRQNVLTCKLRLAGYCVLLFWVLYIISLSRHCSYRVVVP